jgi:hypothetical protein
MRTTQAVILCGAWHDSGRADAAAGRLSTEAESLLRRSKRYTALQT